MKKIILICVLLIILFVASSCGTKQYTDTEPITSGKLILLLDGTRESYDIASYTRVSSGWIVVNTKDGKTIKTNEKNVIIIEGD